LVFKEHEIIDALVLILDKKKPFCTSNLDIIKKYPVIGVLASGKAPGPLVWESYQLFYALRDEDS
jgi:hypothetical protein